MIGYKITPFVAFVVLATVTGIYGIKADAVNKDGVYISEICPHNGSVVYDSVGFYHDYIELKNGGKDEADLSGYGLSDDNSDLMKYVFPEVTLGPGESLRIWADDPSVYHGSDGSEYEDEDSLYTGFGISDHELLYLSSPDEYVIDSVRLPAMKDNAVLVRTGANEKGSVDTIPSVSAEISVPVLSAASGWYKDPFELTIEGCGNKVMFTSDGSDPLIYGTEYTVPVRVYDRSCEPDLYSNIDSFSNVFESGDISSVSKAYVVRAVAIRPDGAYSEEAVATFFVGDELHRICSDTYTVSIVSDPEGLFSSETGIYVAGKTYEMNREKAEEMGMDPRCVPANYNMRGKHWRRDARITLFDRDCKCLYDEDVTINVRGGTSRAMLQKSFALKPRHSGERVFDGLIQGSGDSLDLRTGGEDDAFLTNFRDALNGTIAQNMNVASQHSMCCQVFLDGEYWGCYNLQDHMNTSFIAARYGVPENDINLIKNFEVTSGLDKDYKQYMELDEFIKVNDMADAGNYAAFCEMVDIDSLIDYYCAEIFFANSDAYFNNVAIWRARNTGGSEYADGKWRFLLFDTDDTDSLFDDTADRDSFVSGNMMGINPDTEQYFSNLSRNTEFRARFRARFEELLQNDFSYEKTGPVIDRFEKEYTNPMVRSIQRYGVPSFTAEQYKENVETVREFFARRGGYIGQYLTEHMGEAADED